jgi:RNA polymerase sigma factor for flagellar operon FliA
MTLYYYEEMTMREIGLALGVVESRVSQMHASAVVHLRAALRDLATRGVRDRLPPVPSPREGLKGQMRQPARH